MAGKKTTQITIWTARIEEYWHSYDLVAYGNTPEEALSLLRREYFKREKQARLHGQQLAYTWKGVLEYYGVSPQPITIPSSNME